MAEEGCNDFVVYVSIFFALLAIAVVQILRKLEILYSFTQTADKNWKGHGGEFVAEALQAHGVKHIFTLCGGHISPILVASEKLGIKIIDTRHEANAAFAADAYSRLSGTIGVVAVTAGPGVTNTVTAIKNAQMAESPLLLIGGAAVSLLKGRGALQDIDQMCLFKPLCKFTAAIKRVADIVPTLKKAIAAAQSDTPGPVFVEFPIATLYPMEIIYKETGIRENAYGVKATLTNWYLKRYVSNIFAGAARVQDCNPLPIKVPLPTRKQVEQSVSLVRSAKKPVIVMGSQSVSPPVETRRLAQALESIGIPCFLGGMTRGLLGKQSDIQIRQRRGDALKEADCVILAGTVCDFRLSYGRSLNHSASVIAVNRNKNQLYKNSDMFWKPTVAVQADVGSFMCDIAKQLNDYQCDNDWLKTLTERDVEKERKNRERSKGDLDGKINPLSIFFELDKQLPDNAILVADGGDFVGTAAYILRPRGPLQWLDPGAFGTLGVGGGFALGAKLACPESEMWIIYGDGSCGYSIMEYDTFVRHKIPVISLVGNDACWSQIAREQVPMLGASTGCDLDHTNYEQVAEGLGAVGLKMEKTSMDDISAVLNQARQIAKSGKPVLINAVIGRSDFRKGSISV